MITNTKRYIAVATLSLNDNIKLLKHLRLGFKRKIYWDNYRSKITTHHNNNNFFKRLIQHLVLLPLVEIKVFNVLIDKKNFF